MEILEKIKTGSLLDYYNNYSNLTGLNLKFSKKTEKENKWSTRASYSYTSGSKDFIIELGSKWKEADLAHELLHGQLLFVNGYGIIDPKNDVCELLDNYIQDLVVHEKIHSQFGIRPFDDKFLDERFFWAKDMFRKQHKLIDSFWDKKREPCPRLQKALLYVQSWHFHSLGLDKERKIEYFLQAFRKTYAQSKEMIWAEQIIKEYKDNNNLLDKDSYDRALLKILSLDNLGLEEPIPIKHFKKTGDGSFYLV